MIEQEGSKPTERGGERLENPIRVSKQEQSQDVQTETRTTFKEALGVEAQPEKTSKKLKPLSKAKKEGGNIIVHLEVEDYRDGVRDLQFSVVGKLRLHKGESYTTNMNLKA